MIRRLVSQKSLKTGLPPGSLVHIGQEFGEDSKVRIFCYDQADFLDVDPARLEEFATRRDREQVMWIDVEGVHQPELIKRIGDLFSLHPLVLEDIVNTGQRAKIDDYDDYCFIVAKVLAPDPGGQLIYASQLSIIFTGNTVITFNEFGRGIFDPVLKRLKKANGKIRSRRSDYLLYVLLDLVVDNYFSVLEELTEIIENIEDEIFAEADKSTLMELHTVKRDIILIRKSVWPLREVINGFLRDEIPLVQEETKKYFRDVYDHTVRIIETVESSRDIIAGLFDIYLTSVSQRMNEVMKVLTVIATIFIPLTFIAGIYGMNFQYMPELSWRWGYFAALAMMAILGLGMAIYFKLKDWF